MTDDDAALALRLHAEELEDLRTGGAPRPFFPVAQESKKRSAPEEERPLYTPEWECPVCLCSLGKTPGLVPCGITSCEPFPHNICYECWENLAKPALCPTCRRPCKSIVLHASFINSQSDPAAAAALQRAVDKMRKSAVAAPVQMAPLFLPSFGVNVMWPVPQAPVVRPSVLPQAPVVPPLLTVEQRRTERVKFVTSQISELLNARAEPLPLGDKLIAFSKTVPEFDQRFVYLGCGTTPSGALNEKLFRLAADITPRINAGLANHTVTPAPWQIIPGRKGRTWAYMVFEIKRNN